MEIWVDGGPARARGGSEESIFWNEAFQHARAATAAAVEQRGTPPFLVGTREEIIGEDGRVSAALAGVSQSGGAITGNVDIRESNRIHQQRHRERFKVRLSRLILLYDEASVPWGSLVYYSSGSVNSAAARAREAAGQLQRVGRAT